MRRLPTLLGLCAGLAAIAGLAAAVACGGSGGTIRPTPPSVSVTVSDSPVCGSPSGAYRHIWVTISDVKASTNALAAAGDPSFVDLTPGLSSAPLQIDLLALPSGGSCLLPQLSSAVNVIPGTYKQIRLFLLDNALAMHLSTNQCGLPDAASCVQLASDSSFHPIKLAAEATSGIVIPAQALAGGQVAINDGQATDVNLDFDGCASLLAEATSSGTVYRLTPVIHAGALTSNDVVSGTVVDVGNGVPVTSGRIMVALEQPDANGVDRVVLETVADSTAHFMLCGVPTGTYDLVANVVSGTTAYAPTVITGVPAGANLGNVQLAAGQGINAQFAQITGTVSSQSASGPVQVDVMVSALSQVTSSPQLTVTIPAETTSASELITTHAGSGCPVNTNCAPFLLNVPGLNPSTAQYSPGGSQLLTNTATPASYTLDAQAFIPLSGNVTDCTPSDVTAPNLSVSAGSNVAAGVVAFQGCQ